MGKRSRTSTNEPLPSKPLPSNSKDITLEEGEDGEKVYTAITEGLATVLFPKLATRRDRAGNEVEVQGEVFYNPVQQFNRDLSVLVIKAFGDLYLEEKRAKGCTKKEQGGGGGGKGKGKRNGKQSDALVGDKAGDTRDIEGGDGKAEIAKDSKDSIETEAKEPETPDTRNVPEAMEVDPVVQADTAETTTITLRPPHPSPKFTVLDALSATGLRALRYALEIPFLTSVTANDLDPSATASIAKNISYNETHSTSIDPTTTPETAVSKIKITLANAQHHMYSILSSPVGKYDVIDLDPYGTASPFLDAAVQAVSEGGLLCVTCTDAGVWASTGYSEKCFSLYGGLPAKAEWRHEAGIRLILHSIAMAAGKYGCAIEPLLSLSIDFYARVFVRVRKSPVEVKKLVSSTMVVYNCDEGCGAWVEQRMGRCREEKSKSGNTTNLKFGLARAPTANTNCEYCGFPMHLSGPLYAGPLHSPPFLTHLLNTLPAAATAPSKLYPTLPRILGTLHLALQETTLPNTAFFIVPSRLAKTLHCEAPPTASLRGALVGLGYAVSGTHCRPAAVKTDAPWGVIWEVMRRWVGEGKPVRVLEGMAGWKILHLHDGEVDDKHTTTTAAAAINEEVQPAPSPPPPPPSVSEEKENVTGLSAPEETKPAEKPQEKEETLNLRDLKITFNGSLGKEPTKPAGVVRYQVNPTANWGPMSKAKAKARTFDMLKREEEQEQEKEEIMGEGVDEGERKKEVGPVEKKVKCV